MASIRDISKLSHHSKFDPDIAYYELMLKFRKEFNNKWENVQPSAEIGLEGFSELFTIGAGAFGRVVLVQNSESCYAVKIFIKENVVKTKQVPYVHTEKKVLASIRFPFLIHLEFSSKDFDCLYLGMPYVNGTDLFTHHRKVRRYNEKQARFYVTQVLLGLEYLHFLDMLYRDLKPENILINSNGYIKITDFGFTKKVESRTLTLCGTPEYMAPEIIKSKPYGASVDWWSFGVLIYELVAGHSPFAQYSHDILVMYSKICESEYKMPERFSAPLKDLIDQLLQVDITKRIGTYINGVNDIKQHAWFNHVNWYSLLNQEIPPPHIPETIDLTESSKLNQNRNSSALTKSKTNLHADLFLDF